MLFRQELFRALVHFRHPVFISPVEGAGGIQGLGPEGQGIRIPGEAGELFLQLRLFLQDIGEIAVDGPVQHDEDHVFSPAAQGEACFFPGSGADDGLGFRGGGMDLHQVHGGHAGDCEDQGQERREYRLPLLPEEEDGSRGSGQENPQVQEPVPGGEIRGFLIPQVRGEEAQVCAEEEIIRQGQEAENPEGEGEGFPSLFPGEAEEHPGPEDEGPEGQEGGVQDMQEGGIIPRYGDEFPGRGDDDGGGDQDPGEEGQEDSPQEEGFPFPPPCGAGAAGKGRCGPGRKDCSGSSRAPGRRGNHTAAPGTPRPCRRGSAFPSGGSPSYTAGRRAG